MIAKPEDDPQSVGHQQRQTHEHGEALRGLLGLNLEVLGDVGHHSSKHHGQLTSNSDKLK